MTATFKRLVRFGVFEVDFAAGELRKHGRRVRLQEQPFEVLQSLLEQPGEVVSREALRARLWPNDVFVDFDNGLNNAVNKVRRALGDSADSPRFVETVGRRGYRFIASIDADTRPIPGPAVDWAPAPAPAVSSLAVLPLVNLSGDVRQEFFADGMTDAVISQIAAIRSVRVISRQSILRYKGSRAPMPEIARELGVDGIIEGSVLRVGGNVRISVQLVHGPADRHLWSGRWERRLGDVLVVQAEIATAVADAIRATVTADEAARFARVGPINPAAYEAYLKGRFFWRQRTREGLFRSVEYYRTAITLEPAFALAHAAEAESYGPLGYLGFVAPSASTPSMRAAASRALELDPDLVEGLTALAACEAFHEWRWRDAEAHFRRAIEVNANYSTAYLWYGLLLEIEGRRDESVAARRRGLSLDPLNLRARAAMGEAWLAAGAYAEAAAEFTASLELDPNHFFSRRGLGLIHLIEGRYQHAIDAFGAIHERGSLAHALAAAGRVDDARAALEALNAQAHAEYVSPVQHALAFAGLGDEDRCLSSLERSLEIRAVDLAAVRVDPRFERLRNHPRFRDVIRAMNLPDPQPVHTPQLAVAGPRRLPT